MKDPNEESFPGQILHGTNNRNKKDKTVHSMVYLRPSGNPDTFIGAMLTSSRSSKYNNLHIPGDYFLKTDSNGNAYPFPTKETYVRPRPFIKIVEWQPFFVVGQLTKEGLELVKNGVDGAEPALNENNA